MSRGAAGGRWTKIAGWFLAISYGVGAPLTAWLELREQTMSNRFDLPPLLIYLVCAVQLVCAIGVVLPRFAPRAAAALTATTVGAIGAHLRIGSPATSVAAFVYTAIQLWFGFAARARR